MIGSAANHPVKRHGDLNASTSQAIDVTMTRSNVKRWILANMPAQAITEFKPRGK